MQGNKPYISTGLRHIFAIVSSQISTMMEPVNAILKHEPANRRLEISPRDISFLSSLSIIHAPKDLDIQTRFVLKNSRNKFDWLVHEVLLFGELIMSNKE